MKRESVCVCVLACVRACVCERERERDSVIVCVRGRGRGGWGVVSVRVCMREYVCVGERFNSIQFHSRSYLLRVEHDKLTENVFSHSPQKKRKKER